MHIRCPHCQNPIEVVDETPLREILCPSCGSSFGLVAGDTTETHRTSTRRLAHFELVRELGIGKFGTVWLARDTELDRTVAIKTPRKGALDAEETELFLRDARAAAQLNHPNIVSVHEVGRDGDTVYIVSDYVEGVNLKERLSGGRLSFRESAELVVTVAEALEHAHQSGVVHRDMKPGNIMLDGGGNPHVIDFGLAKREAGEITMTADGHVLGTPAYMSPEQARGKGHDADARSDVYSLGVVLYELLTGELPFRGETQMLIWQIQHDEPPRPRRVNARIPRDVETITLKCLEKEPARRYGSAKDLADDLKRWLEGRPIHARPMGSLVKMARWVRRHPTTTGLAVTAIAAMVAAVAGTTAYVVKQRDADRLARELRVAEETVSVVDRVRTIEESKAGFESRLRKRAEREQAFYAEAGWTPPKSPDARQILKEARADVNAKRFEQALAKHVWFHKHALEHRRSLGGVRLSFALSDWVRLGDIYPPAIDWLRRVRDEAIDDVFNQPLRLVSGAFGDLAAINRSVEEEYNTFEVFRSLDRHDPKRAARVFIRALPMLLDEKQYKLCGKYIRPKEDLSRQLQMLRDTEERFAELPDDSPKETRLLTGTREYFAKSVSQLVALLVLNNRRTEAEDIARQAREARPDSQFHAMLDKALEGEMPQQ